MAWANGPKDLIGTWVVEKARSLVDGKFDFFTMEEVAAELDRRKAAGELDEDPSEMMAGVECGPDDIAGMEHPA